MTGNKIGDEGAKAMSEILEKNTTLTSLDLSCEKEETKGRERKREKTNE